MFAGQLPDVSFPDLLTRLGEEARLGGSYFLCQQDDTMRIAKALEQVCEGFTTVLLLGARHHLPMPPVPLLQLEPKHAPLRADVRIGQHSRQ